MYKAILMDKNEMGQQLTFSTDNHMNSTGIQVFVMYNLVPTSDYTTPNADFSDAALTFVTG